MPASKIIIRATALAAMAAGGAIFVVQSDYGIGIGNAQVTDPVVLTAAFPDDAPDAPALPIIADSAGVRLSAQSTQGADPAQSPPARPATPGAVSAFGLPCGLSMTATAMPGAMVALDIMDPCQPDTRVEIAHAGLVFTAQTDPLGLLTVDVPALETPAVFSVTLPDNRTDASLVGLPDLATVDRVAVMWDDDRQLELHAIEPGGTFGGPGHVWEGAAGSPADAITGAGGFLTELGDSTVENPRMAQVYSFPREILGTDDSVRLSIDAPITEGNCGQPVTAQSLQVGRDGQTRMTPISLTLPGCDAVGDYLVLQNIFRDLRLAAN